MLFRSEACQFPSARVLQFSGTDARKMAEIPARAPTSIWMYRVRHGRETYAGQLERTAARAASGDTYERRWHDNFVNGRRRYTTSEDARGRFFAGVTEDVEFRPELPAPRTRPPRANPFYALSAKDQHTARKRRDPADSNYFSDAESERTASVAEEYREAERAERSEIGRAHV